MALADKVDAEARFPSMLPETGTRFWSEWLDVVGAAPVMDRCAPTLTIIGPGREASVHRIEVFIKQLRHCGLELGHVEEEVSRLCGAPVAQHEKRFKKASFDEVDFGGFWRCGVVGRKKASLMRTQSMGDAILPPRPDQGRASLTKLAYAFFPFPPPPW
ncbi:hypothetical protein CNYM01_12971 [Colletotrichum nymphaeae SA-01]|uniref:Uncharacterized protein n=1 Tax=Colletotrichum nymphaeae SA-01 TaxID=1460502 RepID=A0A135SR28_9PEZI|nr:hypothetical protein CNYM01_12971 [Colletotrichum nymphaeae SA-01]